MSTDGNVRDVIVPIIMCGGVGVRLWPASRRSLPKQFIPLLGDYSTFQSTLIRLASCGLFDRPIVVAHEDCRFVVADQLQAVGLAADIVLEADQRDSALSVAVGTLLATKRSGANTIAMALAADHAIQGDQKFFEACLAASVTARAGRIVAFGVQPDSPSSSFGYIASGELLADGKARKLEAFVEKPSVDVAAGFVAEGFLWNSGNLLFQTGIMQREFERHQADIWEAAQAATGGAVCDLDFLRLAQEAVRQSPKLSIDRAIMEKTENGAVLKTEFGWADLGSWNAIWEREIRDGNGNVLSGSCAVLNVRNSLVRSDDAITTAVVGLNDVVVVSTQDAVLVAPRGVADELKDLHALLIDGGNFAATDHRRVYRPWGYYETFQRGERYLVKRLVVRPGAKLSLQKHAHRSEHWVVVKGVAEVVMAGEVRRLGVNESMFVPVDTPHRLTNPTLEPLEVIEVQVGELLSEDDILRLEDDYDRLP